MFQVVVESEQAATLLLKNNCFRDRVTLIPMNKIQAYMPSNDVLEYVAKVTDGKAQHAVSLVKSNHVQLEKCLQYAFGDSFVCETAEIAKKLAYDPRVQMNCVTLDGDLYSPAGTLTGGSGSSLSQGEPILKKVKELLKAEEELTHVN